MDLHGNAATDFIRGARLLHSFSPGSSKVVCEVRLIGENYSRVETADKDGPVQSDWLANKVIADAVKEMKSDG
jgi:hypothetical protein